MGALLFYITWFVSNKQCMPPALTEIWLVKTTCSNFSGSSGFWEAFFCTRTWSFNSLMMCKLKWIWGKSRLDNCQINGLDFLIFYGDNTGVLKICFSVIWLEFLNRMLSTWGVEWDIYYFLQLQNLNLLIVTPNFDLEMIVTCGKSGKKGKRRHLKKCHQSSTTCGLSHLRYYSSLL